MDDLISRKALLEAAEHNVEFQEGIVDVYIFDSILAGLPAVDDAPAVHGEWIELHEDCLLYTSCDESHRCTQRSS